ncbi:MAG: LPS export ABC transporter periplasmic protein LptC [Endomicrobium sp.]|jgi:LPS export ABC transporter protein LptC|nr:LPS export ABC transporter periplasmic protein LptC [Endomicrobium sp.]
MGVLRYKILSVVLAAFFAAAGSGCKTEKTVIEETPPMPEQAIEKFTVTETESGKLKMILESQSAVINEDNKTANLKLPRVKFYRDGLYASTLVSESADVNLETYDISGHGKCTVETANNEYLQTTDLNYNAKDEMIYSVNDVKMTRGNETITGKGFETDVKLDKVVIKKQRVVLENVN